MEDPEPLPPTPEETEAERRRQAEEAMEQMLLAQEEEESDQDQDDTNLNAPPEEQENEEEDAFAPLNHRNLLQDNNNERKTPFSYIQTSFIVAFGLIYYALRTRQQWYLALVFLSSSKWAYIILGNFLVALLISVFQVFTRIFLNGLRLAEAEGIDHVSIRTQCQDHDSLFALGTRQVLALGRGYARKPFAHDRRSSGDTPRPSMAHNSMATFQIVALSGILAVLGYSRSNSMCSRYHSEWTFCLYLVCL
jgi:hypothetical protein